MFDARSLGPLAELHVHVGREERQPGGNALEQGHEGLTVRFASGGEAEEIFGLLPSEELLKGFGRALENGRGGHS